jgi:hypothetical protein
VEKNSLRRTKYSLKERNEVMKKKRKKINILSIEGNNTRRQKIEKNVSKIHKRKNGRKK